MECEKILLKDFRDQNFTRNRRPISGGIELTSRCNFRCVHCYEAIEREDVSYLETERLLSIIDECISMGTLSFYFTGGEAMLRKDFDEIYVHCRKKGALVGVLSNGTSIDDNKIKLFLEYEPVMIDISIYGATEETYQRITGCKNQFDKVILNLEKLKENGISFNLKTVLLKDNYHELNAMKTIAERFEVPLRFYTDIRPLNNGDKMPQNFMLSKENIVLLEKEDNALKEFYTSIIEEKNDTMCRKKNNRKYLCKIAQNGFFITYDGMLHGCVRERKHGYDLKSGNFKDAWNNYFPKVFIEANSIVKNKCANCEKMKYCDYCPAQFELETGLPECPPKRVCELADLRYKTFANANIL